MMLSLTNLFCFLLLHLVIGVPQINLDLTDWINGSEGDVILQHDCLHVAARIKKETDPYEVISYCMSESSLTWNIQINNSNQIFTFDELYKQNITSEQLYLWSAPIDVIERYQFYINQIATSNEFLSMRTQFFFNCTLPRFGPLCQYSLDIYDPNHLSLNEIIYNYYQQAYNPTSLTCYTHLQCNRGAGSVCLDWSEICDGFIDCQDGVDEQHCWQLEKNECEDSEYRCHIGQCIPAVFFTVDADTLECLDRTDRPSSLPDFNIGITVLFLILKGEPTFAIEDVTCTDRRLTRIGSLTSSCVLQRDKFLTIALFSDKSNLVSDYCLLAFKCISNEQHLMTSTCVDFCTTHNCREIMCENCPEMFFMPNGPVVFGHMYFAYTKNYIINSTRFRVPQYVCYNEQLCSNLSPNRTILSFHSMTCREPLDLPAYFTEHAWNPLTTAIRTLYRDLRKCNKMVDKGLAFCNSSTMYRCMNSTNCISKYRLCDSLVDCDYADDEQCFPVNGSCSKNEFITLFKCKTNNICLNPSRIGDGVCNCDKDEYGLCDDETMPLDYIRKHIAFPTICDGFTELASIDIDGRNETDETECEHWSCNNSYTRCDGFWNCFNGADEVNCDSMPVINCSQHHHICVSPETNQFMCLPLEKANDGHIDCLGSTDEPQLCRANDHQLNNANFHCMNYTNNQCINSGSLCLENQCENEVDQQVCDYTRNFSISNPICYEIYASVRSPVENYFCQRPDDTRKKKIVYFSLDTVSNITKNAINENRNKMITHVSTIKENIRQYEQLCHRGLVLRVWLNNKQNSNTTMCLCPPSFYGDRCQYQNQRVSLTMRFRTSSDSRQTLFALVVLLIDDNDDERTIHSHQQFTYLYSRHCKIKFNRYLLYSSRPKNETKNYLIHIDIYEKLGLTYRGSLIAPFQFSFLPVHRIALQLNIPHTSEKIKTCSNLRCVNGRCIHYSNDLNGIKFCRCDEGWSGKYCTIPHNCTCSSGSLCIGILPNHRSLCVCPIDKWGPQCLLRNMICKNTTCDNNGKCIPLDQNVVSEKNFLCICPEGFSGDRCEIAGTELILSFHEDIKIVTRSMIVHFIEVVNNGQHKNGSTFKMIPINKEPVSVYWSLPFHIAFVDLFDNNYYLVTVQKIFYPSRNISRTIRSSDRCKYINEVLNETIRKLHLLRRIKYYHLPCQNYSSNLSCFYDDTYFCLCNNFGSQRVANCFEFDYMKKFDCFGESNCQHGAQCLQDSFYCPQTSICACPRCYYGNLCQFSSNMFALSLDAILGYDIRPYINIRSQPSIVLVSMILTIIMSIGGLINGILSLITFKNKDARQTGCGLYLLCSSITTLFTITIFALKFFILIVAQINYITNLLFLNIQCYSMDFFLRIALNMDQSLSACVAIERAISSIQGIRFKKQKSKQTAKYIIFVLLFLTIITSIHDPIHRNLLDENENSVRRIWCIVTYSSSYLEIYNSIINIFYVSVPFLINLISAIIIIIMTIRQRTAVHRQKSFGQLLREHCQQHGHLLIASVILAILGLPRLIISFVSICMEANSNSWLFLVGYFISFVPFMLHFIIFVLPSKLFKQSFQKSTGYYRRMIKIRLGLI